MYIHTLPSLMYKYLILNGSVSIPGFGNLEIVRIQSRVDFAQKTYFPPEYIIKFRNTAGSFSSSFTSFLKRNNIVLDETDTLFQKFTKDLKSHIDIEGKLEWAGLGTFTKLSDDLFLFNERVKTISLFDSVTYKHVLREKIEHNVLVGDSEHSNVHMEAYFEEQNRSTTNELWKKSFLYLGLIASLLLFYRFTKGNFSVFQNRIEKISPQTPPQTYSTH